MSVYKMSPKEQGVTLRNVKSNLGVYIERLENIPRCPRLEAIIAGMHDLIDDIDLLAASREITLPERMPT